MEWQEWARDLSVTLELAKSPVGITYTDNPPAGAATGRCRACTALLRAARGETIALSAENSACSGGSLYLGLAPQAPEHRRALRDFLVNGEKLMACPAAIYRSTAMSEVKPPLGMADHVVLAPLESAVLQPDLAVLTVNAWQAARLVGLAHYETGMPMQCDPSGSLCRAVITYPLVGNRLNVAFGDVTARRMDRMPVDELYVSLPWVVLRSVALSLHKSGSGDAPTDLPGALRRMAEQTGGAVTEP